MRLDGGHDSWLGQVVRTEPQAPELAAARGSQREWKPVHLGIAQGAQTRNGLRKCQMPQPHGVLLAKDRYVHDPRECLHEALRVLRRCPRPTRKSPGRRARAPRGGLGKARAQARGDHLGDSGRSARWRWGAFLSMRHRRSPTDRRGRRSAHSGLCPTPTRIGPRHRRCP